MLAFLVFFLNSFIGGSLNPVFVRFSEVDIPPITTTAIRFLGAALIMFPFWFKKRQMITIKDMIKVVPFAGNVVLYAIGIQYTSITMGSILYALVPLFVAVFGFFFIKEKLSKTHIIGLVSSLFGIIILFYGSIKTSSIFSFGTLLGNGIMILGLLSFSFFILGSRILSKKYTTTTILFFSFLVTALLLSILAPVEWTVRSISLNHVSYLTILSLCGLIVLSSVVNYFLYQWLIKNTSAFVASLTQYGTIVFAALSGIIIFHERPTAPLVIGALLVIFGVFVATTYGHIKKRIKPVTINT